MQFTLKEKAGWLLYGAGTGFVVAGTYALSGTWQAIIAIGTAMITAAAGLGLTGLRPTAGGRS